MKGLGIYSGLPLEPSECFWTLHAKAQTLTVSHVLQCAAVTVGHRGTVPSTNFVRKLLARLVASGESADSVARSTAIDDLAKMDARSAAVARSVHCERKSCDRWGVIKKSVRAFLSVTRRLPVDFPEERVMGKRCVRRPVEEKMDIEDHAAVVEWRMPARQRRRLLRDLIWDAADRILATVEGRPGVAKLRNAVVVELGHQDVIVS